MNPSISYLTIDLSANNNFDYVKAVQGDNKTRYVHITLLDNNVPYTLKTGLNAVIRGAKSDNTEIFNSCSISSDGKIIVEITEQMVALAGIGQYEVALYESNTSECLTSFPFKLYVSPASFNAGTVISSDEFTQLTDSISMIQGITSDAATAIQNMNELKENVEDAETNRINSESERISAENIRISNENDRVSKEEIRETNEEVRIENETNRQTNTSTAITNAETATERANKAAKACEDIVIGTGFISSSEKGEANGVATLDSNAIVNRTQLPVYEVISSTEPSGQIVNDFWLQEY